MFKCMPFRCNRHVEAIDKRHQNLTHFPDDIIRYYRTLEELLLDSNQLHELPKGFYKLTQLRKLDISDNEIEKISPEIGNFINLAEFDCNRNDIQELPDSIRYCRNLQVLDISNNPLQTLPGGLTQLRALTELTLNDLSLPALPEDIGCLVNLRSLQGRDNLLKSIPDSLCNIGKLESLDLGSNEIEEIPGLIGKLHNLKVLWLDLNQIKQIPREIGKLKRLQYLEVSENMLETLPEEIQGCISLTDINLAQNSIEYLPSTIGQLANLSILKLEQNQLIVLTPSIGQCSQLTELILTENLLSELPPTLGNLRLLTNLNVDRNRIISIPEEICDCENIGLLFFRDNQISFLPDNIGRLQRLKVLDVAGNKLSYLPYSLTQANLNAIWLAENQATGKIKLQPDFDEATQKDVLTCYLLPQQNFHTPSMENLLQGSINTAENASQGFNAPSPVQKTTNMESVRFAPESDDDDKPSHFVRVNTPHPKDLIKKKEAIKQRAANYKEKEMVNNPTEAQNNNLNTQSNQLPVINAKPFSETVDKVTNDDSNNVATSPTSNSQRILNSMNKIHNRGSNDEEINHSSSKSELKKIDFQKNPEIIPSPAENSPLQGSSYVNKHVDFKLNERNMVIGSSNDQGKKEVEEEQEEAASGSENENENEEKDQTNSSGHFKLRRRDTPHHLKGARLNSPKAQQLDPNEMKEILERYKSAGNNGGHNPGVNKGDNLNGDSSTNPKYNNNQSLNNLKPATIFIPENLRYEELKALIQLIIKINRQEGAGLGIRIAGGKGSNPYKDDDDGIFITRILPESPAKQTGLKVGDKLVKVNQTCLNNLTHQQAADALKDAVKSDNQLILSVLQELDLNKLFFIEIPSGKQNSSPANNEFQYGFRINYNFNTQQQREVEIIFIVDFNRYGQLCKGDILLQINGLNVDSISEKDLNRFVQNSSSANAGEFEIKYLTIYRPFTGEEHTVNKEQNYENSTLTKNSDQNEANKSEAQLNGSIPHDTQDQEAGNKSNKQLNGLPISSSTPLRSQASPKSLESMTSTNGYQIEEVKLVKQNGAMGLSIVGGGNVACHPFGIDNPGIFISKIVPGGAASITNLRVGDRILKVNNIDVTQMSHDDTVDELKRNSSQVILLVSHDPQPKGMQEIILKRTYPEETIGIRINGGIEMKSANIYDASDEGIFVVNLINGTLAHKDARLQVGTRIMEVNGHSLLGVKLSEAQSYLVKSSEYVHMVVCDGFNVPPPGVDPIPINDEPLPNTNNKNSLPFPRVPPPQPPARTILPEPTNGHNKTQNNSCVNGNNQVNGHRDSVDFAKNNNTGAPLQTPNKLQIVSNSNCNYDNLRNIDSDDSRLTSPEPNQNYLLNGTSNSNKIKSTPVNTTPTVNSVHQQVTSSLPLTDKNIMSNIMNKSNNIDIKSQSMMTANTTTTPVSVKNTSDSVRSFKDKMKFFETHKEETVAKPRTKFSFLQEHEIQKIKQEEEKKMSSMTQDELLNLSRQDFGEDITNHKDYATFFSN